MREMNVNVSGYAAGGNRRKRNGKRTEKRRNLIRKIYFRILMTVVAAILIGLMFGMKAVGEENPENSRAAYYHEKEEIFIDVLTSVLADNGIRNAGINISSIIDADGSREYKVSIHHYCFEYMAQEERDSFLARISEVKFADAEVPVTYEINF